MQEALDAGSRVNRARPDAVLLAIDHRGLPLETPPGDPDAERACIEGAAAQLDAMRAAIRANSGDLLLDAAALAETVGLGTWHSPSLWNLAKLAFSEDCAPIYAEHVARLLAALRGRSRKCLVLDLDNMVWGGTAAPACAGCRFPAEAVSHAVWLAPLPARPADGGRAAGRGAVASREAVRRWALRSGQGASPIRRRLPVAGGKRHMGEAVLTAAGVKRWLWRGGFPAPPPVPAV